MTMPVLRPWKRKLMVDTVKAFLPAQETLRRAKRRLSPYKPDPDNARLALAQGLAQIDMLRRCGARLDGTVLELGTGWIPIVPMLFHAAGAQHLVLTDVERLLDAGTVILARNVILDDQATVARALDLPEHKLRARLNSFSHKYLVPFSPRALAPQSVDVVVSRTVLEHVPADVLGQLLDGLVECLTPNALMSHVIDNSDHWEHVDKSLSRLNFLRYDEVVWRFMGLNPQNYQNRLRHSDYQALFTRHGYRVVAEQRDIDARALADCATLPLAAPFRERPAEDLAALTSWFCLALNGDAARPQTVKVMPS